jgi:hypothetical protein
MAILVALVIGLVEWIVLWSFDVKALDAGMIAIAILLVGVLIHYTSPVIKNLISP